MKYNHFVLQFMKERNVKFVKTHYTPQVRTVSAANKKFSRDLAYAQLFFDILSTKNRKKQKNPAMQWSFSVGPIKDFYLVNFMQQTGRQSLNEVCEGVAGLKNHTNKCCRP